MSWIQDLQFATRSLRAHRGTALFAVLTLGAGMAAALTIFCVIEAVLLRALPYPQPERLVALREVAANGHGMALAEPNYHDLAAATTQFQSSTYFNAYIDTVRSGDDSLRATINTSGGEFFKTLAIAPQLGRVFGAGTHDRVAVIGDALWRGLMHARTDILGQPLEFGGERYTVIGVMPPGFAFPASTQAWFPVLDAEQPSRTAHNFEALARLQDGAELSQARVVAATLATQLKTRFGKDIDAVGFSLTPLRDAIAAPVRSALLLLAAGTAFLLLIAMTNTINLLLALNGSRAREFAVRAALGASAMRLARQILFEALILAAAGALLALATTTLALRALHRYALDSLPRGADIALDPNALLVLLAALLSIALCVTAAVVLNQRRHSPIAVLRESGRGQSSGRGTLRARAGLLIAQTALTTVLLIGAGLLGRSFVALLATDPGFVADGAISVQLAQPWTRDADTALAAARRYLNLIDAFAAAPGSAAVGGVSSLPLTEDGADGSFWDASVTSLGASPPPALGSAEFRVASADYFRAAGIPLLRGRSFSASDRADGENVAVISASVARSTWGERDPIGQRIQFGNMDGDMRLLTVVGIVGDVHERSLERAPTGIVYVDLAQRPLAAAEFNIVVRSTLPLATVAPTLRALLAKDAVGIPYTLQTLDALRDAALGQRHFSLMLLGAFAAVALLLAVGGLYGLMAFAVGMRAHEFALRQALGGSARSIVRLVLGSGLRIGAVGIGLGLGCALLGAGALRGMLYGVPASDPATLLGVSAVLLLTLLLACALPARQAIAIAPREALG